MMEKIVKNQETFERWMRLVRVAANRRGFPFEALEKVPYDIKFRHFEANMRPDEFITARVKYAISSLLLTYKEKYIEDHSEWDASFDSKDGFLQVVQQYGGAQKIQLEEIIYANSILKNTI